MVDLRDKYENYSDEDIFSKELPDYESDVYRPVIFDPDEKTRTTSNINKPPEVKFDTDFFFPYKYVTI